MALVGRKSELQQLRQGVSIHRNLLIEGPVGVGKTFLVLSALDDLKRSFIRVDGDGRYTEQKLTGWFDPPIVLKQGYVPEAFVEGPLMKAMASGSVLFVNELNRMPESVQNVLLPAMDEGYLELPKVGEIRAKKGFLVIATQNPREFTATHALSEALMDRFEMLRLDYQSAEEEAEILAPFAAGTDCAPMALALVRSTRNHRVIKRGASIRAAIAVCELVAGGMEFRSASLMALPGRIELLSSDQDATIVIESLLDQLAGEKKKT